MGNILFITGNEAATGFRLAGARHAPADEQNVEAVLLESVSAMETGLVIVDEQLLGRVSEERLRHIEETWPGILLSLPLPERPGIEPADLVGRLIRRAIGYHMRLEA